MPVIKIESKTSNPDYFHLNIKVTEGTIYKEVLQALANYNKKKVDKAFTEGRVELLVRSEGSIRYLPSYSILKQTFNDFLLSPDKFSYNDPVNRGFTKEEIKEYDKEIQDAMEEWLENP